MSGLWTWMDPSPVELCLYIKIQINKIEFPLWACLWGVDGLPIGLPCKAVRYTDPHETPTGQPPGPPV